ncbi:DNA internalization-related competence protein ComEC/Rec2 [Sandaracinus amylolyticus]|uniref:DNA internalization-related competence protein ComEC/Rec2 n=1 Tax=Sandaracinus amylolyticus TaxID=927083 RepID=UPI001F01CE03|nr:DNA internalization-related competence protein ComEC/Rec2 [Sandaracinus amylolyticus]UJR79832.1 DNA internalization-related competence protein ComEC/Rec2 [Sandaracinus amylolyticus]
MGALGWTAGGLVLGVVLSAATGGLDAGWVGPVVALAAGTGLALLARRSDARPRAWVGVGLGALACAAGAGVSTGAGEDVVMVGTAEVRGVVEELRARGDRADAIVRIDDAQGDVALRRGDRIRVRGRAWTEGTRVEGTFALAATPGFRNPSPHPRWPTVDPVRADARAITASTSREIGLRAWIGAARAHVRSALARTLDEPACGVARALILGDLALGEDDEAAVRGAGLAHVLAVSGMHVTLLIGALVWLIARALSWVPAIAMRAEVARIAAGIGVPLALIYAPLAGGAPSAWRAAITGAIAYALRASGRRSDAVAVTAAAVLVFGVVDPATLARPGFLLSIAATAAILAPIADAEERPLRALVIASVRASLATAPLVIWCFEGLPLTGVIANVIVVPIASAVLLPIAAVHAVIASSAPALATPSAAAMDLVARGFLASCEAFAAFPLGRALPPLDVAQGVALTIACGALLMARSMRARVIVVALGLLVMAGAEARLRAIERPRGVLRATFLDVGQGDGALIDMPDGSLMLVDAGGVVGPGIDPGEAAIAPLLRARRRARIDVAVITHPHPDHYGGLAALMARVELGELWDTGQSEDEVPDGELSTMLATARTRGIPVRRPDVLCARPRAFGAARVRVIWPCPSFDPGWDANENSFVIEIAIGARRLLLAGDAEQHSEGALARSGLLSRVDVLKVAHHGSRTSSTAPFLDVLRPRVAVVSAGRGNTFGHPHADVVERLEASAEHVVRTDRDGGVIVTTDGGAIEVRTWSGRTIRLE